MDKMIKTGSEVQAKGCSYKLAVNYLLWFSLGKGTVSL